MRSGATGISEQVVRFHRAPPWSTSRTSRGETLRGDSGKLRDGGEHRYPRVGCKPRVLHQALKVVGLKRSSSLRQGTKSRPYPGEFQVQFLDGAQFAGSVATCYAERNKGTHCSIGRAAASKPVSLGSSPSGCTQKVTWREVRHARRSASVTASSLS